VHPASGSDRRHSSRLSPWCASWRRRLARVAGSQPSACCQRGVGKCFKLIALRGTMAPGTPGQSADDRLLGRLRLLRRVDGRLHHDVLRGVRDGRRLRHDLWHQHQRYLSKRFGFELLPGDRHPAGCYVRPAGLRRVGRLAGKLRRVLRLVFPLVGVSLLCL